MSNLLNEASLIVTPNGYKEGTLYSVIPSDGSGDMSVVRATTATRVNSAGLVELVPYNLLTWSQDFSNVIWVKNEATISSNIATAPNGTTTASKLIENTANDSHHIYQNATTSGVNTFSFYAKKGERTFVYAYADSVGQGKCFNLTSGTLGVNIISAPINATIESVGNDWFRCTITVSITSASALRIGLCSADGTFSYLGNGTSGAFIWGAQLVEGTTALPYQKTETRLNIPRLDYSLGGCPNILLEPQRTNIALQSSSFDSAPWGKGGVSVTANSTTSPSGIADADTLVANGLLSFHIADQTLSVVNGTTYTFSVYAKKNTNNFIQLYGGVTSFGVNVWANFNIDTGVVGSVGSSTTSSIQSVGNGWYRCSIVLSATTTASSSCGIAIVSSNSATRLESNTLSTSVFLWGAQLEAGAYSTSFIPTTTASVTRNLETVVKTGISSLINGSEGVVFIDMAAFQDTATTREIIIGSFPNDYIRFGYTNYGDAIQFRYYSGGALIFNQFYTTTITNFNKIAFGWQSNNFVVYENGVKKLEQLSGATSVAAFNSIDTSVLNFNGKIQSFMIFKTRLSNAQLAQLTTL